jgi:hypothetical protein
MKHRASAYLLILSLVLLTFVPVSFSFSSYDINTLAGKVLSVNNTPGLFLHLSAFVEQEAFVDQPSYSVSSPITPTFVLSSPLDGSTILPPDITVNQDNAAAPQNEPAVAVDPNNPNRIVVGMNDYVTRTWSCTINNIPCSALGDGYSGTYFSNDGGSTWCCVATDPQHTGTLIPGVEHLVGGQYDAGGDPAVAFDNSGNVYFSGLGFDRTTPPNTVTVSKGTFDSNGILHWGPPTFVNPTTSPAIFNDKPWIAVDSHPTSPFEGRVYVSWTEFIFNPVNGMYVKSPIFFAYSTDGGMTFSTPEPIVDNVLYDQGSHIVIGQNGVVYVFWEGSTRLASFNSIYMAKSYDGGVTFSKPVVVSQLVDILPPKYTIFRVNSFPMADIAPNGTLYVTWSSEQLNSVSFYTVTPLCAYFYTPSQIVYQNCHAESFYSKSSDGGNTWSFPVPDFPSLDLKKQSNEGYPVTQPDGSTLSAPSSGRIETVFPSVAISPSGYVYMSAYSSDLISPWQTCAKPATPTAVGRINCLQIGNYVNNARQDYVVRDLTTNVIQNATTHPINTRSQFGGGFIGDYTGIAAGSDNKFHAVWTDTNNKQYVVWWYGFEFVPTQINQEDIAIFSGKF